MHGKRSNNLIVIENGQLSAYHLDDKQVWEVGRPSKNNCPDIKLYSTTVSRRHGKFRNMDGIWFYLDHNGKNGTVHNDKRVKAGLGGRVKPVMLKDGDVFVFGGGEEAVISSKTIWALFSEREYDGYWRVADTRGFTEVAFSGPERTTRYKSPEKGLVVKQESGMAIYMGDVTYLSGDICVTGN